MAKTEFAAFLEDEVSKVKGIAYPVKAGFLRRILIKSAPCSKLHPNPDDEFCFPEIGPNYEIMSGYMNDYRRVMEDQADPLFMDSSIKEPIMVQKIHPSGYMILNGHHRWGAACRMGLKELKIKILDLTLESDLKKMLDSSTSTRRVTLDLDEVVFRPEGDAAAEKPLRFPLSRFYPERLRLGIPALFHMLNSSGYDIWIYTANYYSLDYLRYYFRHYNVRVTGIVTGTARKVSGGAETKKAIEAMISRKYQTTVHIDNQTVIRTDAAAGAFEEYPLSGDSTAWSRDVMEVFEGWKKKGTDRAER